MKLPESYRGYHKGLFKEAFQYCSNMDMPERINCEYKVRGAYRGFERGRLHDAMDRLHNMLVRLDPGELEQFKKDYPDTLDLVNEFATIEELRILK